MLAIQVVGLEPHSHGNLTVSRRVRKRERDRQKKKRKRGHTLPYIQVGISWSLITHKRTTFFLIDQMIMYQFVEPEEGQHSLPEILFLKVWSITKEKIMLS